jgi:hypothetical protein
MVAKLSEGFGWDRVLARDVFSTRGHRGRLRRRTAADRLDGICTGGCGARPDVWRCREGGKRIPGKASTNRGIINRVHSVVGSLALVAREQFRL